MSILIPQGKTVGVPRLQSGDTLTRAEFERRYTAMPSLKKAELIEGEVYVGSPVSPEHGGPHSLISTWLGYYWWNTAGVLTYDNTSVRLDLDNEPQPDVLLMIRPELGGQVRSITGGFIEGAPELVVEVAASSVSYDAGKKLHVYRRNEVREYILWRIEDEALDWFILRDGRYDQLAPAEDGILRSEVFPGLWLDRDASLHGDLLRVKAVIEQGIASPEHAAFVDRLNRR
jgi:Uma2 family endonuclease